MLKYLRITVTALSLTACVLLVALWVRSGGFLDTLMVPAKGRSIAIAYSVNGRLSLSVVPGKIHAWEWEAEKIASNDAGWVRNFVPTDDTLGFQAVIYYRNLFEFCAPLWFAVLVFASLSAATWLPWSRRFSLRTLLIATTLVAVGLGVVIYLAR